MLGQHRKCLSNTVTCESYELFLFLNAEMHGREGKTQNHSGNRLRKEEARTNAEEEHEFNPTGEKKGFLNSLGLRIE